MRKPGLQWSPPPRPVTWGVQPQRHNITRECEIEEAVAIAQVSKKGKNHRFFFPLREIKYLVRSTRAVCALQEALVTATMAELVGGDGLDSRAMDWEMQTTAEGMRRVLEMADMLRLETMHDVVALLHPA